MDYPIINFITFFLIFMSHLITAKKEHVALLFVGDIAFSGPIKYYVEHKYHTYNDSFDEVAPYIRQADISIANLESPFVNQDVYRHMYKGKKLMILAPALSFAGFDAVTVANNHINDFGSEGANFSVEILKNIGIRYFGISFGKYDSSQEPLILERNGVKIGFLGYCDINSVDINCTEMRMLFNSGPAIYRDDIAIRDVNKLKKAKVDIIVVFLHYGEVVHLRPLPYQLHINKQLTSLGVQIIIGAHPHVLQPHYLKDNKLIAYSLGNFLFHPKQMMGGNNPSMYGRLGEKPNAFLIESFEHYVLGNCESVRETQMLQVTISRDGIEGAKDLPLKIAFDPKTKRIHPEPKKKNPKWIAACGSEDKQCHNFETS